MVVTGTDSKPSKVILNTHQVYFFLNLFKFYIAFFFKQAFQIANLVREYCDVLQVSTGLLQPIPLMG